jgi:predicted nuclease of predicted toxin-antitoxin system
VIKFIVDAQLPYRLAILLREKGFDVKHTDDLPNKELTTDPEIRTLAKIENRIVITKDNDFFESYIINKSPSGLLLISTGNIVNKVLFNLFNKHLDLIIKYFETYNFVELTNDELFAHE